MVARLFNASALCAVLTATEKTHKNLRIGVLAGERRIVRLAVTHPPINQLRNSQMRRQSSCFSSVGNDELQKSSQQLRHRCLPLRYRRHGCAALILSAFTSVYGGRPLEDHDFSLRFPAAVSRFASYADVAAEGGAQAASEWSSSANPASAAWPKPDTTPKFRTSFSPQITAIGFGSGNRLYVTTQALTIDAGKWGVFLPSVAQVTSNHEQQRDGLGFRFDAQYYQLQWGKLITPTWTIGANVNVTSSSTRFDVAGTRVGRSRSDSYDLRLGVVHQVLPRLRVGLVIDYGIAPSRTTAVAFNPATFALETQRTTDTAHQVLVRTGIVWRYAEGCDFYLDYQGGVFTDANGTLQVHRFPIGIEHSLIKDVLFLRGGTLIDTRGNIALTTGLGLSLGKRASLDVAYQYDMLPEIRREFGVAQNFVLSLAVGF